MVTALNSLGLAKAPRDTRVVVAMSGGVDSSVTAALVKGAAAEEAAVLGAAVAAEDAMPALSAMGRE